MPNEPLVPVGETIVENQARSLRARAHAAARITGVPARVEVSAAEAADALCAFGSRADLLVIGSSRSGQPGRLFLGTPHETSSTAPRAPSKSESDNPQEMLVLLLPYPFVVLGADELRKWVVRRRRAQSLTASIVPLRYDDDGAPGPIQEHLDGAPRIHRFGGFRSERPDHQQVDDFGPREQQQVCRRPFHAQLRTGCPRR